MSYLDHPWKRQGFFFCRIACKHFPFQQTAVGDPSHKYRIFLNRSHQTNNVLVQANFLLKEIKVKLCLAKWKVRWCHGLWGRLQSKWSGFEPWPGTLCCIQFLGQDTLLSQYLSPPRCINGYW